MKEISIAGVKYPLFFDVEAIESVCFAYGEDDINKVAAGLASTQKSMAGMARAIKLARVSAYEGIKGGYRRINEKCPFETIEEFSAKIVSMGEIMPATIEFASAFQGLFVEPETKKK